MIIFTSLSLDSRWSFRVFTSLWASSLSRLSLLIVSSLLPVWVMKTWRKTRSETQSVQCKALIHSAFEFNNLIKLWLQVVQTDRKTDTKTFHIICCSLWKIITNTATFKKICKKKRHELWSAASSLVLQLFLFSFPPPWTFSPTGGKQRSDLFFGVYSEPRFRFMINCPRGEIHFHSSVPDKDTSTHAASEKIHTYIYR